MFHVSDLHRQAPKSHRKKLARILRRSLRVQKRTRYTIFYLVDFHASDYDDPASKITK